MSIKKYKRETLSSIEAKSLDSINQSVLIDMLLGNDKTSVEIAIILIAENIRIIQEFSPEPEFIISLLLL